ncbi:MAG TPA: chromate transporter [Caulobacteraceae bacterium]
MNRLLSWLHERTMTPGISSAEAEAPGPGRILLAFLQIALSGFGGVLPWARRVLVERRAWLDEDSFNETLALCQTLPGPNVVNLSIVVGSRFAGAVGALAAFAGLTLVPVAIVIALGALYDRFGDVGRIPGAINGLGAAAAGLVATMAAKMARPLVRRRPLGAAPFILAAFIAVGLLRLPLPWVLAGLAPLSVAVAWRSRP